MINKGLGLDKQNKIWTSQLQVDHSEGQYMPMAPSAVQANTVLFFLL